jgi:hypothetical protein
LSPHLGQFSHPSPDPVSRTNAPDVTTRNSAMHEASARRRKDFGESVRVRASAMSTARSLWSDQVTTCNVDG